MSEAKKEIEHLFGGELLEEHSDIRIVQKKRHRKKRINKKWNKKYGFTVETSERASDFLFTVEDWNSLFR